VFGIWTGGGTGGWGFVGGREWREKRWGNGDVGYGTRRRGGGGEHGGGIDLGLCWVGGEGIKGAGGWFWRDLRTLGSG